MFNFLTFFANGTSLLNTYANLKAGQERSRSAISERQFMLDQQRDNIRFDKEKFREATSEYAAISSYQIDMMRQDLLYKRQQLGYNILSSGVGITPTDSAGLLLKHQAYMDEMQSRAQEAQLAHNRPKSNLNHRALENRADYIKSSMRDIRGAMPWQNIGAVVGGLRDLVSIYDKE